MAGLIGLFAYMAVCLPLFPQEITPEGLTVRQMGPEPPKVGGVSPHFTVGTPIALPPVVSVAETAKPLRLPEG